MIELTTLHGKVRAEAARIILPGYEAFELYATPYINPWTKAPEEDRWRITEVRTGCCIGGEEQIGATIEEAILAAGLYLKRYGVTPAVFESAVQRLLAER